MTGPKLTLQKDLLCTVEVGNFRMNKACSVVKKVSGSSQFNSWYPISLWVRS